MKGPVKSPIKRTRRGRMQTIKPPVIAGKITDAVKKGAGKVKDVAVAGLKGYLKGVDAVADKIQEYVPESTGRVGSGRRGNGGRRGGRGRE